MSLKQNPFISLVKYPILTEKTIQLIYKTISIVLQLIKNQIKFQLRPQLKNYLMLKVISVNTSMRPLKRRRVGKFIGQKPRHKRAIVTLAPENSITFFEKN